MQVLHFFKQNSFAELFLGLAGRGPRSPRPRGDWYAYYQPGFPDRTASPRGCGGPVPLPRRYLLVSSLDRNGVYRPLTSQRIDHFDQLVQEKLRKDLPIITTTHAQKHLMEADLGFTKVVCLTISQLYSVSRRNADMGRAQLGMDVWQSTHVVINDFNGARGLKPCLQVTATPGDLIFLSRIYIRPSLSCPSHRQTHSRRDWSYQ